MLAIPKDSNPFKWSEIHSLARTKLEALDKTIRAEIDACKEPLPASGGARHQFFVLLAERADNWAARARDVYSECLKQVGRAPSEWINRSIWENGLTFFVSENLREYMILACGIGPRELKWAQEGSPGVRGTPQVKAVVFTLHQINRVVQKVAEHFRSLSYQTGDWSVELQKLLGSVPPQERQDDRFAAGHAPTSQIRDRGPEQTSLHVSDATDVASEDGVVSESAGDAPWQQLSSDFSKLASEEKGANTPPLNVMGISEPNRSSDLEDWKINDGYSENFRARFELLASEAGKALDPLPIGASPFGYWLHRLYQHLRENRSSLSSRFITDSTSKVEVPVVDNVCEASSTFCLRLQKRAIERDQQERGLATCFRDWIEDNFVNVSVPQQVSARNRVSTVAESARTSIPIHFLSSRLQEINLPRGSTEVGSPRKFFDQVADTHELIWVITPHGLWMAQQPPSVGEYIDADRGQHNKAIGSITPNVSSTTPASGVPEQYPADHDSTIESTADSSATAVPPSPESCEKLRQRVLADRTGTLRTAQAANLLGVAPRTINRWVRDGILSEGPRRGTVVNSSIARKLPKLHPQGNSDGD